ncbi:MAG: glutamine-hydrolyzing carbamoyl-phosphate synthase small subunit [Akkermansia sp.]
MRAILALEDGSVFIGSHFGATGTEVGEACFNTSMTGYQEVLTDPSYSGQIVTMTYPLIGNYGVNPEDGESGKAQVSGFVVAELAKVHSNWRATESLGPWLEKQGVIGIEGVDTRKIAKHLRSAGAMRACLTTELTPEEAVEAARKAPSMEAQHRRQDRLPSHDPGGSGRAGDGRGTAPTEYDIVAFDFGIKYNILRQLRENGFRVTVVPAHTTAEEVLSMNPDGVFLSNGPGDPATLTDIHREVAALIGKVPMFGICLGHQIISHALGAKTFKLKFGHRGANHPVKDLRTGKISITSQNHGFAVDPDTVPDDVKITLINLNDNTVEGIAHRTLPVFSVQYHPEAAPGPRDPQYLFRDFRKMIVASKRQHAR